MIEFQEVVKRCEKICNDDIAVVRLFRKGYLSREEQAEAFLYFKSIHLRNLKKIFKFIDEQPNILEMYIKIVNDVRNVAVLEVQQLIEQYKGYLHSDEQLKTYIESYEKNLPFLFERQFPFVSQSTKKSNMNNNQNLFISVQKEDFFYKTLEKEINKTYNAGVYTATLLLSRKLIENLIIDILRKRYGITSKCGIEKFFDIERGRFLDFSLLEKNLISIKNEFPTLIEEFKFIQLVLPKFREKSNKTAHHRIQFIENLKDLNEYQIKKIVATLIKIEKEI